MEYGVADRAEVTELARSESVDDVPTDVRHMARGCFVDLLTPGW